MRCKRKSKFTIKLKIIGMENGHHYNRSILIFNSKKKKIEYIIKIWSAVSFLRLQLMINFNFNFSSNTQFMHGAHSIIGAYVSQVHSRWIQFTLSLSLHQSPALPHSLIHPHTDGIIQLHQQPTASQGRFLGDLLIILCIAQK